MSETVVSPAGVEGVDSGSRWAWAAYLGASWTWCIGMFLPVLLIRDYGPWAWLIFAVPNVVGAGAMGWVMRSREMSHDYTIHHASACRLFSFVTIAFQLFFSIWMLPQLLGLVGYVGAIVLVQSAFTPVTKRRWLWYAGAAAILVSIGLAVAMGTQNYLHWPTSQGGLDLGSAAGLSLVCLAGFACCPYLDLTFQRARRSTNNADSRFAFGVGFGVLFCSMIVLTFFYAAARMPETSFLQRNGHVTIGSILLGCHLLIQMAYTVHVHADELRSQAAARDDAGVMRAGLGLWLAIALAVGLAAVWANDNGYAWRDSLMLGEAGYRIFMSAYGLLFPAYVLLAIGRRRVPTLPWLLIVVLAAPFYWLAFLDLKMAWAVAGVAVLILGALVVRRFTPTASAAPNE